MEAHGTTGFARGSTCIDWNSWKRVETTETFPDVQSLANLSLSAQSVLLSVSMHDHRPHPWSQAFRRSQQQSSLAFPRSPLATQPRSRPGERYCPKLVNEATDRTRPLFDGLNGNTPHVLNRNEHGGEKWGMELEA